METVTAIDVAANTITITTGKATHVFTITPETRLIHEAADIPLAQFPLNHSVKYRRVSEDGKRSAQRMVRQPQLCVPLLPKLRRPQQNEHPSKLSPPAGPAALEINL